MPERIPVTVLTGTLGAGKTTLLNRILSEDHGRHYAVLVNEFGEIGIDADLIVTGEEELFQMSNGCVCCTVRGDLVRTLHGLLARPVAFDAIVVETTGLAVPGPVAQTFLADPVLLARTRLDSITTVVDAHHIRGQLNDRPEAAEQIAFADQIVLNKTDTVAAAELVAIEGLIRRLNALAPIHRAERAGVALDAVLGRGGFDLDRIGTLDVERHAHGRDCDTPGHEHDADCAHDHGGHQHDAEITSVALTASKAMDGEKVSAWLSALVAEKGADILRAKGIIDVAGEPRRMVFQSVHMLLEGDLQRAWQPGEARSSRLVFIGRHLDRGALEAAFKACAAG